MWGTADFLGGRASRRLPTIAVYGWSMLIGCVFLCIVATVSGGWSEPLGCPGPASRQSRGSWG